MDKHNDPCPCQACRSSCALANGTDYRKCVRYRTWFVKQWDRLRNTFCVSDDTQSVIENKPNFIYVHPDEVKDHCRRLRTETAAKIRTSSAEKPCSNCDQNDTCNIPCEAYLRWYNESLELTRKLISYSEGENNYG